jgi:hypothetical protein
MRIALTLLMIAALGCKQDSAPTCTKAVGTMVPVLLPTRADVSTQTLDERRSNLGAVLAARCRADRWTSVALDCLRNAKAETDIVTCGAKHMARESEQKLVRVLQIAEFRMPPIPPSPPAVEMPDMIRSDIPECEDYRLGIVNLAKCDAIPNETRKAMVDAWNEVVGQWKDLPPEGRAAAVTGCKAAADAVKQAADACK